MRVARGLLRSLALVFLFLMLMAPAARAEFFLGPYVGATIPQNNDLNIQDKTFNFGLTANSVSFDTSLTYGGKVGYWLGFFPYVGVEVDTVRYSPSIDQQTVSLHGTLPFGIGTVAPGTQVTTGRINTVPLVGGGTFPFLPVDKADVKVTGIGFHVMGRLRLLQDKDVPNGRLQPYVGVGPAIFITNVTLKPLTNQSQSSTDVGIQALAGVKYFFHKNFSVFAEYKMSAFSPDFSFATLATFAVPGAIRSTNFSVSGTGFDHSVYGGVAVHFDVM